MIPVVIIHKHGAKDDRYPLDQVVGQAQKFGNATYVIDDEPLAEMHLEDYWEDAAKFEPYYVHLSGNHRAFELFCIQRWYVLRRWMRHQGFDRVLYTDSDVLLYCNAEEQYEPYRECALTLALGSSAATSYFTLAGLEAFCDFVDSVYIGQNAILAEFKRIYAEMQAQGLPGGISDMALFKFFKAEARHVRVGEMTEVHDGATWDHNINSGDGYVMKNGIKRIEWIDKKPYGTRNGGFVRFNSLHFQGGGGKRLLRLCALASSCDPIPGWSGMG